MSELGNQLKSQTLGDVIAPTFKTVGSRVYPDIGSQTGLLDFIAIVDSWRATHAPTYGQVQPDSGVGVSVTLTGDSLTEVIAPGNQEVIYLNAISVLNAGGSPIAANLLLGDTLIANVTVGPTEHVAVPLQGISAIHLSKGQTLSIIKTTGTATDITVNVSTVKSCA